MDELLDVTVERPVLEQLVPPRPASDRALGQRPACRLTVVELQRQREQSLSLISSLAVDNL